MEGPILQEDLSLKSRKKRLADIAFISNVNIMLIGFDGRGNGGITLTPKVLEEHINTVKRILPHIPSFSSTHLPIRNKISYKVMHGPPEAIDEINDHVHQSVKVRLDPFLHPNGIVEILDKYYPSQLASYTLFILNAVVPLDDETSKPYSYWYYNSTGVTDTVTKSVTTMGVSNTQHRFAWIDLSAGPNEYGPTSLGEGGVFEGSLPRLRYQRGQYAVPPGFTAHLASTITKSANMLFTPPLSHFPVPFFKVLEVKLILISDILTAGEDEDAAEKDMWDGVGREVQSLALPGQTVKWEMVKVSLSSCKACVSALAHGTKSQSNNFVKKEGLLAKDVKYVDSKEVYRWLTQLYDSFDDILKIKENGSRKDHQVLPIFHFKLRDQKVVLLDRFYQAKSFPNMVLSIQTDSNDLVIDFTCGGSPMKLRGSDPRRAVLGALLTTGWGIPPLHQVWNHAREEVENDYMWSVVDTTFGPFSHSVSLSFLERDAASRNLLFSLVLQALDEIEGALSDFEVYGQALEQVLSVDVYQSLIRRWIVLLHKSEKALTFLSLHNVPHAMGYINQLVRDVEEFHGLIQTSTSKLNPIVPCPRSLTANLYSWLHFDMQIFFVIIEVIVFGCYVAASFLREKAKNRQHLKV